MFGQVAVSIARRAVSSHCLRQCAFLSRCRMVSTLTRTLRPSCSSGINFEQKRHSQIEIFGPFDPPKQLTFEQVEQRVLKAIRAWDRWPQDKNEVIKLDSSFVNDLGLDSLDHVEIIMSLEDEFGFEIPDADAEKMKTPRDVCEYICEREDVFE